MAKSIKKSGFSIQGFDAAAYKNTEGYVQAIDAMYNQAINEFAKIAATAKIDENKPFAFSDYPATSNRAQQIISQLAAKMKAVITKGSRNQWLYACKKNDEFIASIMNTSKISQAKLQKMQDRNLDALSTFQGRKVNGMDLSQRVWKYTGQMKKTMELGIDVAVGKGTSAAVLSKELRKFLVDPDNLFRRVKDKRGQLGLSKAAKALNPGQGVYRSSYKNAMRLTRSEINLAYKQADQLRWQQLDFVTGYEVKLSNNHTLNGEPFKDICDKLVGRYPKNFVFKGWHPQCRCLVIPILKDKEEFDNDELADLKSALNGTEYKKYDSRNLVTDVPDGFKEWIKENAERSQNWKSQPYFVRDNFVEGSIAGGLKVVQTAQKPAKTIEQRASIQKAWDERNAKLQQMLQMTTNVLKVAKQFPEITDDMLLPLKTSNNPAVIRAEAKKLSLEIASIKKEEKQLSTLLDDVKGLKVQHGLKSTQDLYAAVEKKLQSWEGLSLLDQKKKLTFEIDWVEKNKKYSTWEGSKKAYQKKLNEVNYKVDKQAIQESVENAFDYSAKTKSSKIKEMAGELKTMLKSDAPIAQLKAKASVLNDKVNKLIADNEAKRLKAKIGKLEGLDEEVFSQKYKDAALWAKTAANADKKVRRVIEDVWKKASSEEREAAFRYTSGSSYVNEPLRGIYYTGKYVGVYNGKVDTDHLTNMISRSSYDFDMWVQRGVSSTGAKGMLGVEISGRTLSQVQGDLLGKITVEPGFSSCACSKGAGFSSTDVIYNIYCPRGTNMLYAEPFSAYGKGSGKSWDGMKSQTSFGHEAEMILQKGSKFRVIKVEKSGSRWYIDMEIVAQ